MSEGNVAPIYVFDGDGVLFVGTIDLFTGTIDIFAGGFAESLRQYGISYDEAFRYMHDTTGQPIQKQLF